MVMLDPMKDNANKAPIGRIVEDHMDGEYSLTEAIAKVVAVCRVTYKQATKMVDDRKAFLKHMRYNRRSQ